MYTLKHLVTDSLNTTQEINGQWVPARPLIGSFTDRLRDAWRVLTGNADAFTWPEEAWRDKRRAAVRQNEIYHCTNCGNVEGAQREVICWQCGKGEMVYVDLRPLKKLPDLRTAHYINVVIRQDGKDIALEADWLKTLTGVVKTLKAV